MTPSNPDPDPDHTPGLERGGGVPPGETPPAEGSMSEAGPRNDPPKGWGAAPLIAIAVLVLVMVIGLVGYAVFVHD
ncbi:DUF6480 family protein [Streptomyces sp. NP-1717]|uniref:DUF6480 family protein n=1 Tax=unclassified Streptomyces TaxID=2593676 RepID=UPI001F5DD2ED|nr:DUF6480 family protein [Streptomyces sp. NP-1717]MCI3221829.1 hypothetical protein [Streptomyces sp. NP-1717]WTA77999.1 DUF6480 family protein [Streptomyces sp. NBC_00838]